MNFISPCKSEFSFLLSSPFSLNSNCSFSLGSIIIAALLVRLEFISYTPALSEKSHDISDCCCFIFSFFNLKKSFNNFGELTRRSSANLSSFFVKMLLTA